MQRARDIQERRHRNRPYRTNAELPVRALRTHCEVSEDTARLLERSAQKLGLSVRAFVRVLHMAHTIADLEAAPSLSSAHIAEAIGFRLLDRDAGGNHLGAPARSG